METQRPRAKKNSVSATPKRSPRARLQVHYLERLKRLLSLRYEQNNGLGLEKVRLLDRSIYSTYCDCADLGVGVKAQGQLRRFSVAAAGQVSES